MDIREIKVEAQYCFGQNALELRNLGKVNFVFAPNGSGKTTISNTLANQPANETSRIDWPVAPTDLPVRVFNERYRSTVLNEEVNGIFTMGEQSKEINDEIQELEKQARTRGRQRDEWNATIGSDVDDTGISGLLGDIEEERRNCRDEVFEAHKAVPEAVRAIVFKGVRNKKEAFQAEVLRRHSEDPAVPSGLTWEMLETRAGSVGSDKGRRSCLPTLTKTSLISSEETEYVGRSFSVGGTGEFSELIDRLGNQDWVHDGLKYSHAAGSKCPFCQQEVPPNLALRLEEYFAEGFDLALQRATDIAASVVSGRTVLESELLRIKTALDSESAIDAQPFVEAFENLRTAADLLSAQLDAKRAHPTQPFRLNDVESLADEVVALVQAENEVIEQHNKIVDNQSAERNRLVDDGWALFLSSSEVSAALRRFNGIKESKLRRVSDVRSSIAASFEADTRGSRRIEELQSTISNTSEVADRINGLLAAIGFTRFRLKVVDRRTGHYRIVREDGSAAYDSLSEGEKSFICFAYYCESLLGSAVSGSRPEDVVSVIDDPISSLDSDSLFMVAAWIRDCARKTIAGQSNIRQLIVLTHNTQFHHEASYAGNRTGLNDRRYYRLVKGVDGTTYAVDDGNVSKIRGSYALLWDSVVEAARNDDESDTLHIGVFNCVRRIIEGYFKIVGDIKGNTKPAGLSVADERALFMFDVWANAGSHTIADDIDQSIDVGSTRRFLRLFRRYFDAQGHSAHFDMMIEASGGEDLQRPDAIFARL